MESNSPAQINLLDLTLKRVTRIWWAVVRRAVLLAFGAGFIVGFVEGFLGAMAGMLPAAITYLTGISGIVVGIPAGLYAGYLALKKNYGEFRIGLLGAGQARPAQVAPSSTG